MPRNFQLKFRLNIVVLMLAITVLLDNTIRARILKTRLGFIEGITKEASHGKYFHAYYGIPYAKPPLGKLRFEPPVKADLWDGVFNATQPPAPCPQIDFDSKLYAGQEDCLFLHVFTPLNVKAGANLPVIFYIFGSGFDSEYPTRHGPEYLMSRDIVLVMPNHRLGAIGFLSTGDTVIPGNLALKDQLMAMKWMKENIYDFGGDDRRVTLHGHSAGSVCVHMHTLSPLSKDYFHQVIMQSGLIVSPLTFWDRDTAKGIARAFAAELNCTAHSSHSLKECLLNRTAKELVFAAKNITVLEIKSVNATVPRSTFLPVIEAENVQDAFLTKNPFHAPYPLSEKPWLLGITKNEAAVLIPGNADFIKISEPKLSWPILTGLIWTTKPSDLDFIANWIQIHFFGEEKIKNTTGIVDLTISKIKSGVLYGHGFLEAVRKYEGLKYVYVFDYRYAGGFSTGKKRLNGRYFGATHSDEMPIMFKSNETGVAEEDYAFGDEMITRWVNFVYSGNPNSPFPLNTNVFGAWDAVSSPRLEFLRIDRNGGMEKDYLVEEYGFWNKLPLFSKYFSN